MGRERVPDRSAMDAIVVVPRTGRQWNALNDTGRTPSSAQLRFQERVEAGVFEPFWRDGLLACDAVRAIDDLSVSGKMIGIILTA